MILYRDWVAGVELTWEWKTEMKLQRHSRIYIIEISHRQVRMKIK
uniref:Uncharacterized protein n=1 Tax=Anguilla anguilla TaxID=7936 RepID=A0A0E9T219_ANGAN